MAYTNLNFVPGEILTAAKMNLLAANDASFHDGTGFGDNTILISKIKDVFSTIEQTIGEWIDGKTIYRKLLRGSNLQTINIGNFEEIIDIKMIAKTRQNEWRPIPWTYANGSAVGGTWTIGFYVRDNGDLIFQGGSDILANVNYFHIIVEYTKP